MRSIRTHVVLSASTIAVALTSTQLALAFNATTHKKIVEAAASAMAQAGTNPPPPPEGVSQGDWNEYLATLGSALNGLGNLQSRLQFDGSINVCGYDRSDNLDVIGNVRVRDLHYTANTNPVLAGNGQCTLSATFGESPPPLSELVGTTLGYHAWSIDNMHDDAICQIRPTNALFTQEIRSVVNTFTELGVTALVLPFAAVYCLGSVIISDGCDPLAESFDLGTQFNPVTFIDGLIPGFGDIRSLFGKNLGAMWHFTVFEFGGRHNSPPGIWLPGAGPGFPGSGDIGMMAVADLIGLSLKALPNFFSGDVAEGIDRYGQYDSVSRFRPQWQANTIGHLEWSPSSSAARYGWDVLALSDVRSNAQALGWPLHMLADACMPHHVVGTLSHGHQPLEDAVDRSWETLIPLDAGQLDSILSQSFNWWVQVRGHEVTDFPIQEFMRNVAQQTYQATRSADWPWSELATIENFVNGGGVDHYTSQPVELRGIAEQAIATNIALLAEAGRFVEDPGPAPNTTCPEGTAFNGREPGGQGCTSACVTGGAECTADTQCCFGNGIVCREGVCLPLPE